MRVNIYCSCSLKKDVKIFKKIIRQIKKYLMGFDKNLNFYFSSNIENEKLLINSSIYHLNNSDVYLCYLTKLNTRNIFELAYNKFNLKNKINVVITNIDDVYLDTLADYKYSLTENVDSFCLLLKELIISRLSVKEI